MSVTNTAVTNPVGALDDAQTVCDIREVLDRIGDTWTVPVIIELSRGVRRFMQLQRAVTGVSQRMLTLTLRRLERDGLVTRTVFATIPAQVEYSLTATGAALTGTLLSLASWAVENRDSVIESRRCWDLRSDS